MFAHVKVALSIDETHRIADCLAHQVYQSINKGEGLHYFLHGVDRETLKAIAFLAFPDTNVIETLDVPIGVTGNFLPLKVVALNADIFHLFETAKEWETALFHTLEYITENNVVIITPGTISHLHFYLNLFLLHYRDDENFTKLGFSLSQGLFSNVRSSPLFTPRTMVRLASH